MARDASGMAGAPTRDCDGIHIDHAHTDTKQGTLQCQCDQSRTRCNEFGNSVPGGQRCAAEVPPHLRHLASSAPKIYPKRDRGALAAPWNAPWQGESRKSRAGGRACGIGIRQRLRTATPSSPPHTLPLLRSKSLARQVSIFPDYLIFGT